MYPVEPNLKNRIFPESCKDSYQIYLERYILPAFNGLKSMVNGKTVRIF